MAKEDSLRSKTRKKSKHCGDNYHVRKHACIRAPIIDGLRLGRA